MSRRKDSIEHDDLRKILSAVFTLCLLNRDIKDEQLERLVASAKSQARRKVRSLGLDRAKSIDLVLLGSILHRWNRNSKYLDEDARPFPIPATGRAPSIEALFRAENRKQYFQKGLKDMRSAGLVRRNRAGFYLPKNDSILLHTLTPEMVENLVLSINRLVATLLHNTSASRRREDRLIERNALVTDLPKNKLKEFVLFSREQGAALVATMNDWLENRRARDERLTNRSAQRTVSAGIHVFAFSDKKLRN
jgi:hypothetical protein